MSGDTRQAFDHYKDAYVTAVQDSIAFSGLDYSFFLRSKAALLRDVLADLLPAADAPRLLDVGCGVGALHPLLKSAFGQIHGVDVSAECISRAAANNPWATYQAHDGGRLPVADGEFDIALAVCVAHHVPPPRWPEFFAELRRATRPGGGVCVIEHNPFNPLTRLSVLRCAFDKDAHLLRRSHTANLMREAGLTDVRSRYFVFVPSTANWAQRLERGLAWAPLGAQYVVFGRA